MFILALFLSVNPTFAKDCTTQFNSIKKQFESLYDVDSNRKVLNKIKTKQMTAETKIFSELSFKFNQLDSRNEDQLNEMFELQKQAKSMVRSIVKRAGFKIQNPEISPYDALIGQKNSSDGFVEYQVEVRSLLIMPQDPGPHVTLWVGRNDPKHNPWHVVTVGITENQKFDYVSWRPTNTNRVSATLSEFIKSLMDVDCRTSITSPK